MLPAREAEVRHQGDGTTGTRAEEPPDGDAVALALQDGEALVPAVDAEAVLIGTEGASAGLVRQEAVGAVEIRLDAARSAAYLLHRLKLCSGGAISWTAGGS
jgi:hypothetical protein